MKHISPQNNSFRHRHLLLFCAGTVVLFLAAVAPLGLAQSGPEYPLSPASDFGDAKARPSSPILYVSAYQGNEVQYFPGGGALVANIIKPTGLALDPTGTTLYIATNSTQSQPAAIYTIPVSGGTLTLFYRDSMLNEAHGLAFDSQGNLFVATASGNTVLEFIAPFNPPTTPPITYADYTHDGINDPFSVIFDNTGTTLYVSNGHGGQDGGGSVMKFTAQHAGSTVADSSFDIAYGLAFDQTFTNLYVSSAATQDHHYSIRFINIQTGVVSPFTTSIALKEPLGLLINGNTLFEADKGNNQIQKFSLSNGSGVVFATNVDAPHFLAIKP